MSDDSPATRSTTSALDEPPATGQLSAGEVLHEALREQVAHLLEQEPGARQVIPDAVAEMRVTTRRLRSILLGFSRTLDASVTRPIAEELKWLGAQLADESDTQALVERLSEDVGILPEDMVVGPVVADLREAVRQLAERGADTINLALDDPRYLALQQNLEQLVANPPLTDRADQDALVELPKSLAKAVRALDRRLIEAAELPPGQARDEALHEARKADKRVRYMSELIAPLVGQPAHRLHHQAEKLQKLLGDHQDSVIARSELRRLSAEVHAIGHSAFTYGLLYALEYQRAERVVEELPSRLDRFHDPSTLAWLPVRADPETEDPDTADSDSADSDSADSDSADSDSAS
jgi:CHAD domain-containing protein